jgi:4-amino-4-deoxychorismate lyase
VAGVLRSQIYRLAKENGLSIKEKMFSKDELLTADEIFVCNSVIGIWPVSNIENTIYPVGSITQILQQALAQSKK